MFERLLGPGKDPVQNQEDLENNSYFRGRRARGWVNKSQRDHNQMRKHHQQNVKTFVDEAISIGRVDNSDLNKNFLETFIKTADAQIRKAFIGIDDNGDRETTRDSKGWFRSGVETFVPVLGSLASQFPDSSNSYRIPPVRAAVEKAVEHIRQQMVAKFQTEKAAAGLNAANFDNFVSRPAGPDGQHNLKSLLDEALDKMINDTHLREWEEMYRQGIAEHEGKTEIHKANVAVGGGIGGAVKPGDGSSFSTGSGVNKLNFFAKIMGADSTRARVNYTNKGLKFSDIREDNPENIKFVIAHIIKSGMKSVEITDFTEKIRIEIYQELVCRGVQIKPTDADKNRPEIQELIRKQKAATDNFTDHINNTVAQEINPPAAGAAVAPQQFSFDYDPPVEAVPAGGAGAPPPVVPVVPAAPGGAPVAGGAGAQYSN